MIARAADIQDRPERLPGRGGAASKRLRALAAWLRRALARSAAADAKPHPLREEPPTGSRVVGVAGNLRDTRVLTDFQRCCEAALRPDAGRVRADLTGVTAADTRLIATLILLRRRAEAEGVRLELDVPASVYAWIALCQVEALLHPRTAGDTPRPGDQGGAASNRSSQAPSAPTRPCRAVSST